MATYSSTGLTTRTKEEILAAIYASWASKSALGSDFRTSPDSPQAQIAEVVAEAIAQNEETLAGIISAYSRSTASGQFLDDAGERVGVLRQQATKSTVTATVNLDAGTTLPAGSQAADSTDDGEIYETLADATNSGGSPADVSVEMQAVVAGTSTFVTAGQLTDIVTPVAGWNSVTNAADAVAGTDLEIDSAYRLRIASALAGAGTATVDAIRSAIALLDTVTSVTVLENSTHSTNSLGLPPHSIRAVVLGGDADEIAQAIWDNKAAGIRATGSTSGTAVDSSSQDQTVAFSRPTEVPIYLDFGLTTDDDYVGDSEFKEQMVTLAETFFTVGEDVIRAKLIALAMGITGVTDVTTMELGTSASPSGTANLTITALQLATFDTSRIVIV